MLVCFMEIMDSERSEMRTQCSNCKQINTKILGGPRIVIKQVDAHTHVIMHGHAMPFH